MPLSAQQKIQEAEYREPYHWHLKTNSKFRYRQVSRFIAEELQNSGSGLILDAGCGDGRGTFEVSSFLGQESFFVGIDYSYRAICYAKELVAGKNFLVADFTAVPFKDQTFDGIVVREVLEHLPEAEEKLCWQELHRLLKPGGKLILTAPGKALPLSKKHFRHYSPESIRERFQQTKLKEIKIFGYARYPEGFTKGFYYVTTLLPWVWKLWIKKWNIVPPQEGMTIIASAVK